MLARGLAAATGIPNFAAKGMTREENKATHTPIVCSKRLFIVDVYYYKR